MKINLYDDFKRYLETQELSPNTINTYIANVKNVERYVRDNFETDFSIDNISDVKGYMISNWATSIMDKQVTTRAIYLVSAKVFLKFLYAMQYVTFDLTSALPDVPNVERHHSIHPDQYKPKSNYTDDELTRLMAQCPKNTFVGCRNAAIIAVGVMTGLRASELASLTIGDIYDTDGTTNIARKGTHGNKVRVVIPDSVKAYVDPYINQRKKLGIVCTHNSPLFVNRSGNELNRYGLYMALKPVCEKAGVPTGIHRLRHTALSHVAKSSDPVVARDLAGQKTIVINKYLHTEESELRQAADMLGDWFTDLT